MIPLFNEGEENYALTKMSERKFKMGEAFTSGFEREVTSGAISKKIDGKLELMQTKMFNNHGLSKDGFFSIKEAVKE